MTPARGAADLACADLQAWALCIPVPVEHRARLGIGAACASS